MNKKIDFNLNNNIVYSTYSKDEYDRTCLIPSITFNELKNIYIQLDLYKLYHMPVHKNSIKNNQYHSRKIFF